MEQEQREREKERLKGGASSSTNDSSKNKPCINLNSFGLVANLSMHCYA